MTTGIRNKELYTGKKQFSVTKDKKMRSILTPKNTSHMVVKKVDDAPRIEDGKMTKVETYAWKEDGVTVYHVEKHVEIDKPRVEEKVVHEKDQIIESVVEVPHRLYVNKVMEVESSKVVEKVVEVPRYVEEPEIIEVPEIQYKYMIEQRCKQMNHVHNSTIVKEVEVLQYVDNPVYVEKTVDVKIPVKRNLPQFYESVLVYEVTVPRLMLQYQEIEIPVYIPVFHECFEFDEEKLPQEDIKSLGLDKRMLSLNEVDNNIIKDMMMYSLCKSSLNQNPTKSVTPWNLSSFNTATFNVPEKEESVVRDTSNSSIKQNPEVEAPVVNDDSFPNKRPASTLSYARSGTPREGTSGGPDISGLERVDSGEATGRKSFLEGFSSIPYETIRDSEIHFDGQSDAQSERFSGKANDTLLEKESDEEIPSGRSHIDESQEDRKYNRLSSGTSTDEEKQISDMSRKLSNRSSWDQERNENWGNQEEEQENALPPARSTELESESSFGSGIVPSSETPPPIWN